MNLVQNIIAQTDFNPIIVLFLTRVEVDLTSDSFNFNPIIVLFLTMQKVKSCNQNLFQSYYSLISNNAIYQGEPQEREFQSYYSLISNLRVYFNSRYT